jgi:hypothetical protein
MYGTIASSKGGARRAAALRQGLEENAYTYYVLSIKKTIH